jgi:Flp pilus assembly protein TadD
MLKLTVGIAVALLAVSCASSGTPAQSDSGVRQASRNRTVLSLDEIQQSAARDAYHAVQLLRPDWLRSRGSVSTRDTRPATVTVYVDGQRYGGASSLEQFRMGSFKEMRYYSGSEATSRWGTGHAGGVIYLTTR